MVVALMILVIFPPILDLIAEALGIYTPVNMLFLLGFCFALIIIYTLTIAISKMADEIKTLTQKLALLDKTLKELTEDPNHR